MRRFSAFYDEAAFLGERIVITRHGKALAALVPVGDVELIEALEDKIDIDDAPPSQQKNCTNASASNVCTSSSSPLARPSRSKN